ncbi:MAG: DUF2244 domain-containing protein [Methylobacterium sp.]|nr:DUF2244 domain-containing protein [Methylobacterium sp.]
MTQDNPKSTDESRESPVFDAVITPHRSLSPRGLFWLMAFLLFVTTAMSIPFYLLGAWPVLGFLGLDIVLIYLAFRYHNATARAYEQVVVSRIELLLRSVSWRGVVREKCFNPAWARIEREEHPEFGTEKIEIVQGCERVEVAAALGREERGEFADAFQKALATAKRG